MKIYSKIEWIWVDDQLIEINSESFSYDGPLCLAEEVVEVIEEAILDPIEDVIQDIVDPVIDQIEDPYIPNPWDPDQDTGGTITTGTIFDDPIFGGDGGYDYEVDANSIAPGLKTSPFEPRTSGLPVIYGTRRTKGQVILRETSTDNKQLFLYYALCEGERINATSPNPGSEPASILTTTSYYEFAYTKGSDNGRGTTSVAQDCTTAENTWINTAPTWTASHLCKGVAMAFYKFTYDQTEMNRLPKLYFDMSGRSITGNDDNPINQLKDYLTNTRFGAGLNSSVLDTTTFNSARDYCDAADSNGDKRFTSNIILDTRKTILSNVKKILSPCFGQIHYRNGKYYAHIDQSFSGTPVITLTTDNIIGGIRLSNAGKRAKYNKVIVVYTDPNDEWKSSEVSYPDINVTAENTIHSAYLTADNNKPLEKRLSMPAVTNFQQARYMAKIIVKQSRANMTVNVIATTEAADVIPGDIVDITYSTFGWTTKQFRVRTVKIAGGGIAMTLTEHTNSVYDRDTTITTPSASARTTTRDSSSITQVTGLTATESTYTTRDGAGVKNKVALSWDDISDNFLSAYEISYKLGSASVYQVVGETQETSIDVFEVGVGTFDFRVVARNVEGTKATATVASLVCTGLPTPPEVMTNLIINSIGPTVALARWTISESIDVQQGGFYRIAHSVDSTVTNWDNGVVISQRIAGNQTTAIVPLLAGTYLLRATDSSNQKSMPATFVHDGSSVQALSTLSTITEEPTFAGTKVEMVATDDILKLTSATDFDNISDIDALDDWDALTGIYSRTDGEWSGATPYYEFANKIDLTTVKNVRLASYAKFYVTNWTDKIDSRSGLIDTWTDFDNVNEGVTDLNLEFAQTDDDPASGGATWSEWYDFYVTETKARGFKFRVFPISDASSHQITIENLRVYAQQISS
jgi:hypothetical protein